MKKLLYCAAALAGLFFAASCQQDNLEPVQEGTAVSFTVEAPAALQTKSIADGLNVNELIYEVWLTETLGDLTKNAQKLYQATADMAVENGVNKATLTLDLVNDQKFTVLFWAQVKEAGAYDTDELTEVTYAKSEYNANDESLAAFYAVAYVNDCQHVTKAGAATGSQVTLYRPFAQLNLGTLNTSTAYKVALVESEVNVKNVNTVFNVATSAATQPEEMTFKMAAVPTDPAILTVNGASYEYAGMNYMFAGDNVTVEYDIVTSLNGGMEATVNNIVTEVPLKENYRTNIIGNLLTSKVDYEIVVDADFNEPDEDVVENATVVKTDAEFKAALYEDKTHINIYIDPTYTRASDDVFEVEVSATSEDLYWGGASTKTINIDANGYTISFKHTNGDWNNIRCKNDAAVIIIKNAHLTNTEKNNGPWDRHDITFRNAVELYNVTSDKAIALENDSKLVDVEISDVHPDNSEAYGLWISAKGQTVDLDGVSIIAHETKSGDRGIAINDQYVNTPAKVILNVKNSTFKTQKKAAVLVKSKAGAVINWGRGNDITGVAADPANAVWVDGERKNIEDVTVTGASVIIEGQVSSTPVVTNAEELKAAIAAANNDKQTVILLKAGTYTGTFNIDGKNVALIGEDDVVIDGLVFGLGASHILLRNITLTNEHPAGSGITNRTKADYYCLGAYAAAFVIEDCVFNVSNQGNAAGKGAIHIGDGFNAYSANDEYELIVKNTVFNCNGERPIRAKTSSWIEGCTFVDQHRYAIQVQGNEQAATEKVIFSNNKIINPCTTSGEAFAAGVSISKSQKLSDAAFTISGNTLESAAFEDLKFVYDISDNVQITTCTLNGKQIAAGRCVSIPGVTDAKEVVMDYTDGLAYAVTNADLLAALKDGATHIYLYPGNYEFAENPAIAAENVVIEGADKEACVLKISKQLRADNKSLTLKNLTTDVPAGLAYTEHTFAWIHYFKEFNMIDCNSNGRIRLNSHKANIEGCTFTVTTSSGFDGYAVHYQGADKSTVNVKSCTFNTAGKAIVMYNEGNPVFDLNVEDCTFTSSDPSTDKAAIQMHTEYGISGTLDITECTATGFADVNGGLWNELNNNTKKPTQKFTITVDGNTVQQAIPEGYTEVAAGLYKNGVKYIVSSADGLQKMNEMFADKSAGRDAVLELYADINFAGKTWTPVDSHADTAFEIAEINGNGHTISNMTINGQAMFTRFAGSGDVVVKDITFDNATVSSTDINVSVLTVQSYQNVLLDNVDVKNSSFTGAYKVAPLIGTVYDEKAGNTVTATLKNCDVENCTVTGTSYDFCTTGMVAFVYEGNNDRIEFENCTVKDVKLYANPNGYAAHAAIYVNDADTDDCINEAEGVTVTNVTFEAL